jgi:hypothetical protein
LEELVVVLLGGGEGEEGEEAQECEGEAGEHCLWCSFWGFARGVPVYLLFLSQVDPWIDVEGVSGWWF